MDCINDAALIYHLPAKLIIAVLQTERGKVGQIVKNKNGSYDIGPMQINSIQLSELKKYGITEHDIQYDSCTNIKVGSWILSKKIAHESDLLKGVGDYNSHTFQMNKNYYTKVKMNYTKINRVLA